MLNLPDGRVEVVAEGPSDRIGLLLEAIRRGPATSRVDDMAVSDEPPEGKFTEFEIRR